MSELRRMIDHVAREKGLDREILISTLEEAMQSAARRKLGSKVEVDVAYNDEIGEVEVFEFKEVVEELTDPDTQIGFEDARRLDPDCELGDELGIKVETADFGRIAAQSAKQVIIQRMKDAERDIIFEDFKDRKGEIINGIVQRFDKGSIVVNLGRTEAILLAREQVPREGYRPGDRVRAYVLDVKRVSRGPQIILSRTHPGFVEALFELEVPEIAEGIVTIEGVAREAGSRTKLGVSSSDRDVDPVGACVGMKGSRVQAVVQELRGEKIDIIAYDSDPARYVVNALAPAEISRVVVDESNNTMEVIVADEMLSLAIGRRGQNVRLASKLTGWKIDVKSESKYSESLRDGYRSLLDVVGVSDIGADTLFQAGYASADALAYANAADLAALPGIDDERAQRLIDDARDYIQRRRQASDAARAGGQAQREAPVAPAADE
ncbi:transcription termination factor NusA [Desulfarculus baarsii DSM 2075]|uniref:Transcription termination/antitermination protein NusA n=1 Tax=Desulfarculus baarsii (strain ATCC 33931 / DSM 2075 / LMG 7858 / VKM B-1802 / 2st14) TaxID=644282 RepID=E1QFC3_DESB2|nr:transcription termination factor NusA [Desulfarculus baarsii]ADK84259.1 transcription termination factor NusA [Desulfarculus baarsii DSM 2075]